VFAPGKSGYYQSVVLVYNDVGNLIDRNNIGYCVVVNDVVVYLNQTGPGQPDALRPPDDLAIRREYVGYSYYNGTPGPYATVDVVECYNFTYTAVEPGAGGNGQAGSYSRITFNVEPGDIIDVAVGQGGGAGKIRTAPTNGDSGGPYYQGSLATNPFAGGVIAPGTSGYYVFGFGRAYEVVQGFGDLRVSFQPYQWCVVVDGVIVYGPSTAAPPESFAKPTAFVGNSYYVESGNQYYGEYDAVQCYTFQYTAAGPGGNISAGGQPGLGYSPKEIFSSRNPGPGNPVIPVKNVAYNEFMNAYGVWDPDTGLPNFTRTYEVYFPSSSKYVFAMGCDTYGRVYLDDVLFMEGQGYANTGHPVEYVLYVEQGFHTVKMQGQGASLLPIWTTRSGGQANPAGAPVYVGYYWGPVPQNPAYGFMNEYGIWSVPASFMPNGQGTELVPIWNSVSFPISGYYTIQAAIFGTGYRQDTAGTPGQVAIDGTPVWNLPATWGELLTQTVYITAGTHSIGVFATSAYPSSGDEQGIISTMAVSIQLNAGVPGANSMGLAIALPGSLNAYSGGVGGNSGQQGISGSGGGGGGATTLFKNGVPIAVAGGGGGGGGAGRLNRILQCDAPGLGGFNTAYDGVPTGTAGQTYLGEGGGGGGGGGGSTGPGGGGGGTALVFDILTIGGGGGGGGGSSRAFLWSGAGGGAGDIRYASVSVSPGDSLGIDVAAGGAAGSARDGPFSSGTPGTAGGTSQFRVNGAVVSTAPGGGGGQQAQPSPPTPGAGGSGGTGTQVLTPTAGTNNDTPEFFCTGGTGGKGYLAPTDASGPYSYGNTGAGGIGQTETSGQTGTVYGGGGGGGGNNASRDQAGYNPAPGGSGAVVISYTSPDGVPVLSGGAITIVGLRVTHVYSVPGTRTVYSGSGSGVVGGGLGGGTRGTGATGFGGANGASYGDYIEAATNLDTPGQESPYWDRRRGNGGTGGSAIVLARSLAQPGGAGYAVVVFKQSGVRVKDEDEWKSPRVIWIKQNNVWTQVDTVWVKDSTGEWSKVLGSNSSAPDFEPLYNQMGWTYYPYPLGDAPAPPPPPPDPPVGYVADTGTSWAMF
jgi:hypothetical protein